MRSLLWPTVLAASIILAGCAGTPHATSAGPSPSKTFAPAPVPTVDDVTGSIAGTVVDDEERPIIGVNVEISKTDLAAKTDAQGKFTFNGLDAGRYALIFDRIGYVQGIKKVDVAAEEVANVTVVLQAIVIPDDPYYLTIPKVAYLHATWVLVTYELWLNGVNDTNLNSAMCDPCRFTAYMENGTVDVLSETLWRSGTSVNQESLLGPAGVNGQIWLQYISGSTDDDPGGTHADNAYMHDRQSRHLGETSVVEFAKEDHVAIWVSGSLAGVNVEHKVEIDTTFAYVQPLPESFSALPPE